MKRCMPFDHNNNIAFYFYNSLKSECDDDNYIAMHITFLVVRNNSAYILYVCLKCIFNLKTMKWIDRCLIIILLWCKNQYTCFFKVQKVRNLHLSPFLPLFQYWIQYPFYINTHYRILNGTRIESYKCIFRCYWTFDFWFHFIF